MTELEKDKEREKTEIRVTIAFTPTEMDALIKIARYQNRSKSSTVRNMVIECWKEIKERVELGL